MEGRCLVCGTGPMMEAASCPRCDTPHHTDCFAYNSGCAVYGCMESSAESPPRPQLAVLFNGRYLARVSLLAPHSTIESIVEEPSTSQANSCEVENHTRSWNNYTTFAYSSFGLLALYNPLSLIIAAPALAAIKKIDSALREALDKSE